MRDETEDNKPKPQETTVGDAKMTADERVAAARIGRFHEHVAIDAVWCADAIAIAEAHAAAAVAEVVDERNVLLGRATQAEDAVEQLKARVAELEAEVERLRATIDVGLRDICAVLLLAPISVEARTTLSRVESSLVTALAPQAPPARKEGE